MKKHFLCVLIFLAGISFNGISQATFSADVTAGCSPLCSNFSDLSMTGLAWSWDFGDAGTATVQSPSHCYTNPGVYTVTLIVQFSGGPDTAYGTISVYPNPVVAFTATNTGNNTLSFTNQTTGAVGYYWDFGDTTYSTQSSLSHQYIYSGPHTICLVAYSVNGCADSTCQTFTVTGVHEINTSLGWTIFPNPSQGQISIHFESALQNAEVMRIENMLGELILQKEISSDATIDLSGQSAGIYFVRIGNSPPQKLVIE